MVYLIKQSAIPTEAPSLSDLINYIDSVTGKPRQCVLSDLPLSQSQINTIGGITGNFTLNNSGFTAQLGKRHLIDNRNNTVEVQLPSNPELYQSIEFLLLGTNTVLFRVNGKKYIGQNFDFRTATRYQLFAMVFCGDVLGWIPTHPTVTSPNGNAHDFVSYGDMNGLFYFYGTSFNTVAWANPVTSGRITFTATGNTTSTTAIVDRVLTDGGNQYGSGNLTIDFNTRDVAITKVTYRCAGSFKWRRFTLSGSNDGTNYTTIGSYEFPDGTNPYWTFVDISNSGFWRYYRITMPSNANWNNGTATISISELELYGISVIR